ncbi:TniB protein [Paenibacillus sp. BK033]|uniref:TniB family NTP-binding protein n=1 Tax=Paenibacillus sp. BK033 TaxID=2512133 RepID=UPI001048EB5E|nr:TniB family NTP-binding protein [Paenibacillus sp. BK033]TCM99384.1 TniB protein [Paenibacillus sp. BK033]
MMNKENLKRLNGDPIDDNELTNRIASLEAIVIHHKRFNDILGSIKDCHLLQQKSPNKKGFCILGETGVGKSTIFKIYEASYPRTSGEKYIQNHFCEYKKIPILRVELASNSKPLNVASKMLEMLGDPLYWSGTEKVLTGRLKNYIIECEVELVIIDELQHLIDTDTRNVISKAADWLKQLLNDINLPIVFGGIIDKADRIFKANEQLDSRFPDKIKFLPFSYNSEDEIREFRAFLKNIDRQLPLPESTNIYDPYMAEKIFYVTGGSPRILNHLLYHSIILALREGKDTIDESHLQHGFEKIIINTRPMKNPFNGKALILSAALAELQKELEKKDRQNRTGLFSQTSF